MSRQIQLSGQRYDLRHLKSFIISGRVDGCDVPLRVSVRFSPHCWSEKASAKEFAEGNAFQEKEGVFRKFSLERYEASKRLPDIFQNIWLRTIADTRRGSHVWIDTKTKPHPYAIFIKLKASKTPGVDVVCGVESAHFRSETRNIHKLTNKKRQKYGIRFNAAVVQTLCAEPYLHADLEDEYSVPGL